MAAPGGAPAASLEAAIVQAVAAEPCAFLFDCPAGGDCARNLPFSWRDSNILFGLHPAAAMRIGAGDADPLGRLDRFLGPLETGDAAIAAGFIAYDFGGCIEPATASARPHGAAPLMYFALYNEYFEYSPSSRRLVRHRAGEPFAQEEPARIGVVPRPEAGSADRDAGIAAVLSDFTRQQYEAAVAAAREYILAGDIFEVNLSQRFTGQSDMAAGDLYLRLRALNPAPYAALLTCREGAVLSSSPELFLRVRGGMVTTRPIKGTARRADDPVEDMRVAQKLSVSEKDNAELAMIIDLERNDLGRVCRYGTVRVAERARVETFARVHHLVSTVEGRLRDGITLGRLIGATFPGGSVTGAPKVRAMQIIDELEPCRRAVYTGSLGYVLPDGRAEFNIAIRTICQLGGRLSFHVGGAVTAESDPRAEYLETLAKAEGIMHALGQPPRQE